ncbi:MAG: hypothetical protein ACJASB_000837 [Shewanella psychromarinicola]|jgi:hypothetical protein
MGPPSFLAHEARDDEHEELMAKTGQDPSREVFEAGI